MMDDVSNQGRMIADMDADADVVLEEAKEVVDDAKADQDAKVDESVDIQGRQEESQAEIYKIDLDHANKVLSIQEDESEPAKVQEVVEVVTTAKLITEVVTTASTTITDVGVPVGTKRVVIRDPEESTSTTSTLIHIEAKSKDKGKGILVEELNPLKKQAQIKQDEKYARELEAELNRNVDWDEVIDHVKKKAKEDPAVKRYQALKNKPQTEAQARKNMMIYLKNVAGFKMDYFKGMSYDDICPIFEAKFDSNVAFLQKTKEQIEEEESRALKRINETLAEKVAKRQKLDEETGYVCVLNGGAIDWKSAKQSIFATLSIEAKYIASFDASKEAVWVRKFIYGLGVVLTIKEPISIYCDNTGAIIIANESGINKGARHFHAKVHNLREVIEYDNVKLEKVYTNDNLAHSFTKALAFPKHS
nr:retrovirus-related Pol polyprotein from transposon TNT 1-94 [Tanacetum cinerariifolium]